MRYQDALIVAAWLLYVLWATRLTLRQMREDRDLMDARIRSVLTRVSSTTPTAKATHQS
jgi:hypothetical protein